MNIIEFAVRRKIFICMLFIGLTMLGYVSYRHLPVELLPNAELPVLIVYIGGYLETDPQYMENQAVIPLEGVIGTLEEIERIESLVRRRAGTIWVFYNQDTDMKYAYLKLLAKVNEVKSSLPEEFQVEVFKIDTEQIANEFMSLQVLGGGGLDRVRNLIDRKITERLESIDGIATVDVFGGREKAVEIILDEQACMANGITAAQIPSLIRKNGQSNAFVGHAGGRYKQYFVSVITEFTDVSELENIVVRQKGPVLLKDIAAVYVGVKRETSISRVNGKDAVTIQLGRDAQVNLIELSHDTRSVIDRLNADLKTEDIEIVIRSDSAERMEKNINMIIRLALLGGLLAVIILWMFLKNLRLVLVVALAVPISIFTAFNLFYAFGISINSLTLIGMALAVGMLLDNSIVVLENIYRQFSKGRDSAAAVVQGTKEVWRSIFAATLTTVTVFLPFLFSSVAFIRLIGRHIGVSVVSTLIISMVVALLLVPMVTHFFLRRSRGIDTAKFQIVTRKNRLLGIYTLLLKSALRFPARTIIISVVLFFASILICLGLSVNVSRESESRDIDLYVNMPRGATLESTDAAVAELEKRMENVAEKQDLISKINEDNAKMTIRLKENYHKAANRSYAQIRGAVMGHIGKFELADVGFDPPLSRSRSRRGTGSGPSGLLRMFGIGAQEEKVVIKGDDFSRMRNFAEDLEHYLGDLASVTSVELNIAENSPEIHLYFDTRLMSHYDVSLDRIAGELRTFEGEFTSEMLRYKQGTDVYDIVIRKESPEGRSTDKTIDDLRRLPVPGQGGSMHEMQQLGGIIYSYGTSGINRINQEKQIELRYKFLDEVNSSRALLDASRIEVDRLIAGIKVPSGIAVEVIHDESQYGEYLFLIGVAFILIYMILASVFESISTPFVMMFTIPLAAIGSFWALILTGTSMFTTYTITGFLILLGVVVNNGIILIDYTNILRRRGYRRNSALMAAGQARVRPILITAITTIVGMLPLAMGKSEDATIHGAPFAITVIGGLSLSTVFTLVLVPTVYSGLETSLEWIRKLDYRIKLIQLACFLGCCLLIYFNVDSLIWRLAGLFAAVLLIPGLAWFIMSSLRRARAEYIKPGEPINIEIRNLAKIYDRDARFVREWKKGKRMQEQAARVRTYERFEDSDRYIWQLPLLGFLIYFVYYYIRSPFWLFALSHAIYFYVLYIWEPVRAMMERRHAVTGKRFYVRATRCFLQSFIWGFPLFNLILFYFRWRNISIVLFIAALWYFSLVVYTTSRRLYRDRIDIEALTGRFSRLKIWFYRLVKMIPLIGRKRAPVKALDGVSLDIGHGMFGLLGPNGAGKTTLMRIICGVLDQSYGKVRINGVDTGEKREELQGLIGYLPQEFGTYENLTAYEFLSYQAILKNLTDRDEREKMVDYVLSAVHIEENRDQKIGSFSGGMKQRIGIAQTLLHLPRILVVDEPTAGLDPRERIRFRNLLVELGRERVVIFSTHIIEDISSSCNYVAVLNEGRLCYMGEPVKMTASADGHVWQFHVPPGEFESVRKKLLVVHHMRDGERIRVRCLAETRPSDEARTVKPTLEDAYLWLLRRSGETFDTDEV